MDTSFATRTFAEDVREIDEFFAVLVAKIEPDSVPCCEVIDLYSALEVVKRRAESTMLLLARRVEDAGRWKREGFRSAAAQLAGIAGTSVSAARNQLEASKQVAKLPATRRALRKGKLSAAKTEAIAAAAEIAPEAEADLLAGAEDAPLAEVKEKCLRARGKDRDAAYKRIRANRYLKEFTDAEGGWNLHARGTPDDAVAFRAAHQPILDELFKQARAEGRHEPYEAYAFDALIELARREANGTAAADPTPTEPGTEPGTTPDPANAKPKAKAKATPAKYLAVLRADFEALRRGSVEGDEVCEIAGLGPIPVSIARTVLTDAILKVVITKGVDVMNVTHLGRYVTVAQQVALLWQSSECTREGCTRTYRLENDHREDWVRTKHTRLDETDPLCSHDHDLKTYQGWALIAGTGKRPMVPPHDPRHPNYRAPPRPA